VHRNRLGLPSRFVLMAEAADWSLDT